MLRKPVTCSNLPAGIKHSQHLHLGLLHWDGCCGVQGTEQLCHDGSYSVRREESSLCMEKMYSRHVRAHLKKVMQLSQCRKINTNAEESGQEKETT